MRKNRFRYYTLRDGLSVNKERVISPEVRIPKIDKSIFLFRSCSASLDFPGMEIAAREILGRLDMDVVTDPDQTCCSGYLMSCSVYGPELSLAINARNLSLAERRGLNVYTICNNCHVHINEMSHLLAEHPDKLEEANRLIGRFGYEYRGETHVYHVQELYYRLRDRIAAKVVRHLNGLRVAAHYGCDYLSQKYGIIADSTMPTFHEEIIELLGGTPVFYRERLACCGYAVAQGVTHREETVLPHIAKKLGSAKKEGVELITTVCPGCNLALDREQLSLNNDGIAKLDIPIIDLSQLIALCLGTPIEKLGFQANAISLDKVLKKIVL